MQRDVNDVIKDLNVIAKITPGLTLSTTTMTIIDHTSWTTSFWRRYQGESRYQTIAFIRTLLYEATNLYVETRIKDLLNSLVAAVQALPNLKNTYISDDVIVEEISKLYTDMANKISTYAVVSWCENILIEEVKYEDPDNTLTEEVKRESESLESDDEETESTVTLSETESTGTLSEIEKEELKKSSYDIEQMVTLSDIRNYKSEQLSNSEDSESSTDSEDNFNMDSGPDSFINDSINNYINQTKIEPVRAHPFRNRFTSSVSEISDFSTEKELPYYGTDRGCYPPLVHLAIKFHHWLKDD